MKSLLIVEDEKLIRQGIRTMAQRCGVPIDTILECSNGEMALEVLKEQDIDVMFTDIRMPKMDGIRLVQEVSKLENKPLIVAVSGYDDFSYAVEMLRNGVKEYILKPVEREIITEVLSRLNAEIEQKKSREKNERQIGVQQIKHILRQNSLPQEELQLLEQNYGAHFYRNGFVICMTASTVEAEDANIVMVLDDICDGKVCLVDADHLEPFALNELSDAPAGISSVCHGIREIPKAFAEARKAREYAFCLGRTMHYPTDMEISVPDGLKKQAEKMLEEQAQMQRLQLIGTDKTEELITGWERIFAEVAKARIAPADFFATMDSFLKEFPKIYRNVLEENDKIDILHSEHFLEFQNLEEYKDFLLNWILAIHQRINRQTDSGKNQQKIKMAIDYITQNYNKDLNMAVVSNYISMNYSLFSFAFKQYTGSNFVNYLKDIRIREAKRLLADTDMKIVEISRSIGYDNEKNFMKVFKASCGVSPTEYRKNVTREARV